MKNLWKDAVWSKVISAIIIAVGAFLISFAYSLVTDLSVEESIIYLWKYEILLGPTLLIIIIVYFLISIVKSIIKSKSKPKNIEELEDKFHEKFNKIVSEEDKITYRFNAFVSMYSGLPYISHLKVYCNNHETEVLMSKSRGCNRQGCFNYNISYSESLIKDEIETHLLGEWEKIKGSTKYEQ